MLISDPTEHGSDDDRVEAIKFAHELFGKSRDLWSPMLKHVVLSLHDFYTGEASTIPELLPTCTRFKRALTKEKWEDMSYPDSFAIETLDKVCESVATHLARRIRSGDHCEDMFSGVTVDCARLAPQFAIAATKANRFMKRATKTAQKGTDFKDSFLHLSAATEAAEKLQEQVGKVSDEHLREKAHPCTGPMLCATGSVPAWAGPPVGCRCHSVVQPSYNIR